MPIQKSEAKPAVFETFCINGILRRHDQDLGGILLPAGVIAVRVGGDNHRAGS